MILLGVWKAERVGRAENAVDAETDILYFVFLLPVEKKKMFVFFL